MQLLINENQRELKEHGVYGFPFAISNEVLAHYEKGTFLWHWHPEIELTLFVEGSMEYQVNDRVYHVQKGDGLFCNSNALHSGHMLQGKNCEYISITFHPRLVYGFENSLLFEKYIHPLTSDSSLGAIHFNQMDAWHTSVIQRLIAINQLYMEQNETWEMQIVILLQQIMLLIYQNRHEMTRGHAADSATFERVSIILGYIHQHYMEKITLEDIADTIHICRSECCRFFKESTGMALFEYLIQYRIQQSAALLSSTDLSITEIAMRTGFATPSYFTKIFRRQMGCTPREYREKKK
ncbi:MAG: helix-turn-helix domain-containing protein [Lachnospiraceae bacterium]